MEKNLVKVNAEVLAEAVRNIIPEIEVMVQETVKNNNTKFMQLCIGNGTIRPSIFVEDFITAIENGEMSVEDAASKIVEIYNNAKDTEMQLPDLSDFEDVKALLRVRLVNIPRNEGREIFTKQFLGDMAYSAIIAINSSKESKRVVNVSPEMLSCWGITEKELFEICISNTHADSQTEVSDILEFLLSSMPPFLPEYQSTMALMNSADYEPKMYLLMDNTNGAATIASPRAIEQMDNLLRKTGQEVLTIIPSSVSELILIPGLNEMENIEDTIGEVNEVEVPADQILADKPFYYVGEGCFATTDTVASFLTKVEA